MSLQVQLYAHASTEVLGQNARTGAVHMLKDNQRIEVPVTEEAIQAAIANVEWTVQRIIQNDFPMRPHPGKCAACDFRALCPKQAQTFQAGTNPPPDIYVPGGKQAARAFSEFQSGP
jgi:DNA helicase-2/ATP-dependent DNA helicase PcrA